MSGVSVADKKSIGIVGGMGPAATADLFSLIVRLTKAGQDNEHIHIYIDCNTEIPDRTRAILSGGTSPLTQLATSAKKLEAMGADFLVMPCNTAHYFLPQLAGEVDIPILSMIDTTAKEILSRGFEKIGLLATDGVIKTKLYADRLGALGIEVLVPDTAGQDSVMGMIYDGIKAGNAAYEPAPFINVAAGLMAKGAQALLLGCTEVSMAFSRLALPYPVVDPTLTLARAAVRAAGYPLKGE